MKDLRRFLAEIVIGIVSALLPAPERNRITAERGISPAPWSFGLGLIQLVVGIALFLDGGVAYMRGEAMLLSALLLENWDPSMTTNHFRAAGALGWFFWLTHPLAWAFGSIAVIGIVRITAFVASREPVAEPLVWAALRTAQELRRQVALRRRETRLGPLRPDRLVPGDAGELQVVSCREKSGWTEWVAIEIDERHYRLVEIEETRDGDWEAIGYRLRPIGPGELIRRLVRYEA